MPEPSSICRRMLSSVAGIPRPGDPGPPSFRCAGPALSSLYSLCMSYPYSGVDLRRHPDAYEIGRGEQGVFHAEPYKGELLPLWSFKDARAAERSADEIYERFLDYRAEGDFVGMDVARKYLQMGYTRSRRYAKYRGGNKGKSPWRGPTPRRAGRRRSSTRSGAKSPRTEST